MTNRGIQPMKCMSVNTPPSPVSSLSYLFQFSSQPSGCNWSLVGCVDLTRFYIPSCQVASMMHNNCLYIFCQDTFIKHPTQSPSLWHQTWHRPYTWSMKYDVKDTEISLNEVPPNFTQLLKNKSYGLCFVLSFLFLKGKKEGRNERSSIQF